ncbi:hypothetical protein QTP86_017436 [Hemibagrus guttatus]|nr:hypothetical protein QTP86_017436 [Hemibagrus guttatus]
MASQGPGRKRTPNRNAATPEEDALNVIAREAEARLAAKRAARAEAREIRMKELERQQKEVSDDEECMSLGSRSNVPLDVDSFGAQTGENSSSSVASLLRKSASSSGLRDLDHVTIPDLPNLDDGLDRDFFEKGSSRASTLSAATLTSLGGASSRKGSDGSSVTADTETSLQDIKEIHELKDQIQDVEAKYMQSLKELKDSLAQMEEKYRKAMVSNAQLDNEKSNLMYEVDTLKDSLMELEELLAESHRECEEKSKDLEREKHAHSILQFQFNKQNETLKQSEELLTEIRQLHFKQEGFVREISDLQETIEWKDKKIGALEKQKEYSDAIRNERDELRDEVVQLKDILKKHGIVLGPDLCTNGEVEGNVSSGSACTELQHGSSVLGTQELQLFRDENVGGSRGGQFQHQQDFDHEVQENHLPPSVSGSSSESPVVAHYNNGGFGNDLNNSIAKIQNNVEKPQAVCEGEAEEISKDNVITEGMRTDQQEIPVHDKRSETIKEGNPDSTEKFPCKIAEKDVVHLDETVVGDSQIKMISNSTPSDKIDTTSNSQSASVSGKKKKKKRKNKQKQKQSSDEKAVRSEIGDENENQLTESSSVQTAEENSVCSEEATINKKVPDNMNIGENIELVHKEAESLELQRPNTGPGFILGSISNQSDCTSSADFIRAPDSKTEIKIGVPAYDDPLERTTEELNASTGKSKILSNNDDAELKDVVAVCADFPESGFEVKPENEETDTTSDVVEMEAVDEMIHLDETYTLAEASAGTQLDDAVITNEVSKEGQEISTVTQLYDALVVDEVPEKEQEPSKDKQLDDAVVTDEIPELTQETSTVTQLYDALVADEVPEKEQEPSKDKQLDDAVVTDEIPELEQETSAGTQLDGFSSDEIPEWSKKHLSQQLDELSCSEVPEKDKKHLHCSEVSEEDQETSAVIQLDDAVVTDEIPELTQETSTVKQLDEAVVADEVPEKEHKTYKDKQLDDAVVTDEIPELEQETSTVKQLDGILVTNEVPEKEQETSTVTQLDDALVADEIPELEQETSAVTQLDDAVVTDEVPEEKQETQEPTHIDQEFKVEQHEGEMEYGESFELNMKVISSEGNLLGDPECHQEHNNIPDHKLQTDEQNVSAEGEGVTAEQIATTVGNQNKCQQHSVMGYEEQGPEGHEEMVHFEHSERAKQETSPNDLLPETGKLDEVADDVAVQEAGQSMREQEISEVKEGTSEINREDAKNGSKKESKKGKGKSKEDCKMS